MTTTDELTGFVKDALARGVARQEVAQVLGRAGWDAARVRAALAGFADLAFPIPVPKPRPYWSAREAFLYLLLFGALYLSAYHAGSLLFVFIDRAFPDPKATARAITFLGEQLRWSGATLVVSLPIFLYVSVLTNREIAKEPSARDSKVRRWLTYLTLLVAACTAFGDVITLIYTVLGDDLTARFVLKASTVGVVSGAVFAYYRSSLADERQERAK